MSFEKRLRESLNDSLNSCYSRALDDTDDRNFVKEKLFSDLMKLLVKENMATAPTKRDKVTEAINVLSEFFYWAEFKCLRAPVDDDFMDMDDALHVITAKFDLWYNKFDKEIAAAEQKNDRIASICELDKTRYQ
jgi:hypothetical protein